MKRLSIVIPTYNESENVEPFYKKLSSVLNGKDFSDIEYELIYVNDGSRDNSLELISDIAKKDKKVRVVNFSRNFGKEIATSAGIRYATGDAVMMIDADGQHPPQLIKQFIKLWKDGNDVVIGVRTKNKNEGFIKKWGSKLFYKLFNSTTGVGLIPGSTDFRLIDRKVRDEFVKLGEHHRITRGLIDWIGFKRTTLEFGAEERMGGVASYRVSKLFQLAANTFVSLTLAPLYFLGVLGLIITLLALVLGVFVLFEQVLLGDPLSMHFTGTAMLGMLTLFLIGIVLLSQAVIALYISHIHTESQGRPLYIVDPASSVRLDEK